MEDAPPAGLAPGEALARERGCQHDGTGQLRDEREGGDALDEGGDAAQLRDPRGCLDEHPVAQSGPPADQEEEQERGTGHEPEPADLDESEDDEVTEWAPVRPGVQDDEPGDAHRRGRGEQRVQRPRPRPVRGGDRERQDHRADGDDDREADEQNGGRGTRPFDPPGRRDPVFAGLHELDPDAFVPGSATMERHGRTLGACVGNRRQDGSPAG